VTPFTTCLAGRGEGRRGRGGSRARDGARRGWAGRRGKGRATGADPGSGRGGGPRGAGPGGSVAGGGPHLHRGEEGAARGRPRGAGGRIRRAADCPRAAEGWPSMWGDHVSRRQAERRSHATRSSPPRPKGRRATSFKLGKAYEALGRTSRTPRLVTKK